MIYEVKAAITTLGKEGPMSLLRKISAYCSQLWNGLKFLTQSRPTLSAPEDNLDFADSTCNGLISPSQVREEILGLLNLLAKKTPKTVLEIGTANGGTLFLFASVAARDARIISIDLPNGIHGGGYAWWRTLIYRKFARENQSVHLIRDDSRAAGTIDQLKQLVVGRGLDLLFIDGDHTYFGVKQDFINYSPLVNKGGAIVFHDVCRHREGMQCEVDVFWEEIKKEHRYVEFIKDPSQGWGGIGVLLV